MGKGEGKGGMITYHPKRCAGWVVLTKCGTRNGSVITRCIPYGLFSAFIALIVKLDNGGDWGLFHQLGEESRQASLFDHPYALQIWGVAVGFLLVFRGNLGYARHWEARGSLAKMSSYLSDVAMNAVCFDEANKDMNQYREWKQVRPSLCCAASLSGTLPPPLLCVFCCTQAELTWCAAP